MNREIEQAKKMLERTIPKMVAIQLDLAADLKMIDADPTQIEQIVLNTGCNSADAMPDGGLFRITTENIRLDEDFCANHPEAKPGEYVRLSVDDTGHGIDEEILQHIYDPFFTTKELGKGTGLGLASVYGIVKNHGGAISCISEPGKGTRFDIFFPAIHSVLEDGPVQKKAGSVQGGSEVILVVDDEEIIRDLTEQVLVRYGYRVIKAVSGEEAIEIFEKENRQIGLVILDLSMPGIGGYKCLTELIRIDENAKVVISSGYSMESEVSLASGAAGFIEKPYQLDELLVRVREVLDG